MTLFFSCAGHKLTYLLTYNGGCVGKVWLLLTCVGGTQLKTTGEGLMEEIAMQKDAAQTGYSATVDPAALSTMQSFEEGYHLNSSSVFGVMQIMVHVLL